VNCCQIVPSLEQRHGGPSKSALGLAAELAKGSNRVELLTTDPELGWHRTEAALEIHAFRRDWPKSICQSAGLRKHLAKTNADVVHHHSIWLRTLHYAHRTAKRTGSPLIVSPRGMMDAWAWHHHQKRKSFARAFIHPGAFEAVSGWHATSPEEAEAIRKLGFKQPVCVAPNGVDIPASEEMEAAAAHWRKILPDCMQKPVALFYSRFHKKKRLLELIDLWVEKGPKDWILLVVGIPEEQTPKMLEDYVHRAGCIGRIRVFDGFDHPAPYPIASLFLLPSHSENFGLSIAEALASGVPALVTDTTPWSGLNRTGSGWCVPWLDYGMALVAATAEGPERLKVRGSKAQEWVQREFSWNKPAQLLSEFYSKLRADSPALRS
jgi:glycosyltransferase involved in cell wall biosynthesis